jgi:hypothetical protein
VLERSGSGFGVDEDGSSAASLHLCRWREVAVEGKRREMERNLEIVFSATVIYIYMLEVSVE